MSLFKKDPNNPDDLRPAEGSTEELYTPPQCSGSNHVGTVSEYGRDQSKGVKHMTCQGCGSNWDEAI